MVDKGNKKAEFKNNKATLSPLYSNTYGLFTSEDVIILDFGFYGPSYYGEHNIEDAQIARISLSWEDAEGLSNLLQKRIKEHKKDRKKPRRTTKSKG